MKDQNCLSTTKSNCIECKENYFLNSEKFCV